MKRYFLYAVISFDGESELVNVDDEDGDWVRYEDMKHLLPTKPEPRNQTFSPE